MKSSGGDRSGHLRVYDVARTAHLERLASMTPATFVFRRRSYDFDPERRPDSADVRRLSRARTLRLLGSPLKAVELNEPAAVNTWPSTLLYVALLRLRRLLLRTDVRVVTYAIENADPSRQVAGRLRLPLPLARLLTRAVTAFLLPRGARVAFGTEQARRQYAATWPALQARCEVRTFTALALACAGCEPGAPTDSVVFLGAFEARKGLMVLLDAWDDVRRARPAATLELLGKGPLSEHVLAWAGDRPEVTVRLDPSRDQIHRTLAAARCLVLVSLPDGYWREQVGLPILEGLSHGCEVVASSQTGIAPWLDEHGHCVVDVEGGADPRRVATGILRALGSRRTAAEIAASLPTVDGRIEADRWLFDD